MNRPKDIGTAAETKIVRYLVVNGWPNAERRALRGIKDVGDVTGTPGIVWESKGGHAAWNASDNQVEQWLTETELERANAREHLGVLVVARRQKNVRDWWAVMWADQLARLLAVDPNVNDLERFDLTSVTPVRTTLALLVPLLRAAGWGDPNDPEETA